MIPAYAANASGADVQFNPRSFSYTFDINSETSDSEGEELFKKILQWIFSAYSIVFWILPWVTCLILTAEIWFFSKSKMIKRKTVKQNSKEESANLTVSANKNAMKASISKWYQENRDQIKLLKVLVTIIVVYTIASLPMATLLMIHSIPGLNVPVALQPISELLSMMSYMFSGCCNIFIYHNSNTFKKRLLPEKPESVKLVEKHLSLKAQQVRKVVSEYRTVIQDFFRISQNFLIIKLSELFKNLCMKKTTG